MSSVFLLMTIFVVFVTIDAYLDYKFSRVLKRSLFQANVAISIPKDHHRWILGQKGQRLKELEKNTGTKITIPSINDNSDKITIVGTRESIEKAVHEIRVISDEQVYFYHRIVYVAM